MHQLTVELASSLAEVSEAQQKLEAQASYHLADIALAGFGRAVDAVQAVRAAPRVTPAAEAAREVEALSKDVAMRAEATLAAIAVLPASALRVALKRVLTKDRAKAEGALVELRKAAARREVFDALKDVSWWVMLAALVLIAARLGLTSVDASGWLRR